MRGEDLLAGALVLTVFGVALVVIEGFLQLAGADVRARISRAVFRRLLR